MVCPNCHSTDIVAIQGQNYCLNCGQLVAGPPVETVAATAKPLAVAKGEPKPAELPPVSPSTVAPPAKAETPVIRAKASIINHNKPLRVEPASIGAVHPRAGGTALKTKPKAKVESAPKIEPPKIEPPKPTPTPKSTSKPAPKPETKTKAKPEPEAPRHTVAAVHTIDLRKREPISGFEELATKLTYVRHEKATAKPKIKTEKVRHPPMALGSTIATAVQSIWFRDFWPYALLMAALVALPVAALAYLSGSDFWRQWQLLPAGSSLAQIMQLFSRLSLSFLNGLNLNLLAAAIVGYVILSELNKGFAAGAVVYGAVRLADKRSASTKKWTQVGLNALWGNFGLDILYAVFFAVIATSAGAGLSWLWTSTIQDYLRWGSIGVLAAVAGSLLLGLSVARLVARNAVVLAGYTAPAALWFGIKLFARDFWFCTLAGAISAVFNLLAVAVYGLLASAIISRVNLVMDQPLLGSALASLYIFTSMIVFSVLFIFNLVYWLQVYRTLASRHLPDQAGSLVSARQPSASSRLNAILLFAWPALVLGLFVSTFLLRNSG